MKHARCASCHHAACTHSGRHSYCGSCYSLGRPFRHPFSLETSLFEDASDCRACERKLELLSASPPVPS